MRISEIIEKNEQSIILLEILIPRENNQNTVNIRGTGFIVSADGTFVTCAHVYKEIPGDQLQYLGVRIPGGTNEKGITTYGRYPIELLKMDEENDVAVMKIVSEKKVSFTSIQGFGDSNAVKAGEEAVFIGYPLALELMMLGFGITLNANRSIISSIKKRGIDGSLHFFLVDTHINNGSSGSPVFSESTGKVIGIASGKISQNIQLPDGKKVDVPANMGICRPIQYAERLIKQIDTK